MTTILENKTIAVTGPTGIVGVPIVQQLAAKNRVIALARFSDEGVRSTFESWGVECHAVDFSDPDFSAVPSEVDAVLNLAVAKTQDWRTDLAANAEAAGHVMSHFRGAGAVLHCSTGAVYRPTGEPFKEDSAFGDHHKDLYQTYSISKIAAESVVRFAAREFDLPVTIARLNVPYSDSNGWPYFHLQMMRAGMEIPVHPDGARYNLIHADDMVADVPVLLDNATVEATVVNWASPEVVSTEEWCNHLAELSGCPAPKWNETTETVPSTILDTTQIEALRPDRLVDWQAGMRSIVEANAA